MRLNQEVRIGRYYGRVDRIENGKALVCGKRSVKWVAVESLQLVHRCDQCREERTELGLCGACERDMQASEAYWSGDYQRYLELSAAT